MADDADKSGRDSLVTRLPNDFAPVAAGKVFVLHVFVDDRDENWDDLILTSRDDVAMDAKGACDWIADQAPDDAHLEFSNHGNPYYWYAYDVELDMVIPDKSADGTYWTQQAAQALGITNIDGDKDSDGRDVFTDELNDLMLSYHPECDKVVILFHPPKTGRSWSQDRYGIGVVYPGESFCGDQLEATYAHEMLHLFSAADEYEENGECPRYQCDELVAHPWLPHDTWTLNANCEDCADNLFSSCVMRCPLINIAYLGMCDYTRGQLGWRDMNDNDQDDFTEGTPSSWFSEARVYISDYTATFHGHAWAPQEQIDGVEWQMNDTVDPDDWTLLATAPYDGAWDERYEFFWFQEIPIPSDGTHRIWMRALSSTDQTSGFDSIDIIRDTTGPSQVSYISVTPSCHTTWMNLDEVTVSWGPATDALSSIAAYGITVDEWQNTPGQYGTVQTNRQYVFSDIPHSGHWYAHVQAQDSAGNWGANRSYMFLIDFDHPVMDSLWTTTHTEQTWSNVTAASFTWTSSDIASGVEKYGFKHDTDPDTQLPTPSGTSYTSEDTVTVTMADDGIQWFHVAAQDSAGNWSETRTVELWIWTGAPAAPIVTTDPALYDDWQPIQYATFVWNEPACPSGIAGYSYNLVAGAVGQPPDTIVDDLPARQKSYTGLGHGTHTFGVRARDNAGNWGVPGYATIYLDLTGPSGVTNLVTTSHGNAIGQLDPAQSNDPTVDITFTAASDDASGLYYHGVVWDHSSLTVPSAANIMSASATPAFTSPALTTGNWWAHVGAVDEVGNWTSAAAVAHLGPIVIDMQPPPPPRACWTVSGSGVVDVYWSENLLEPIDHYVVCRSTDEDLLGDAIATVTQDSTYHDTFPGLTFVNGNVYYYRVRAVDLVNLTGPPSEPGVGEPEFVSPGNGAVYGSLAALVTPSRGGVRAVTGSSYTLHGNVTISSGDALTMQSYEQLYSTDRTGTRQLIIHGRLQAQGAGGYRPLLGATWAQAGAWGGLRLESPDPGCVLSRVDVRHAVTNVLWHGANPSIDLCDIGYATANGLDIVVGPEETGAITNTTIHDCGQYGLTLFAFGNSTSDVRLNTARNNGSGIYWSTVFPGTPPLLLDINQNIVRNNVQDGIACGWGGATTLIQNNTVHGNSRGIVFEHEGWAISAPLIQNNTISANVVAGIHVADMAQPQVVSNNIVANSQWGVHATDEGAPTLRSNTINGSSVGIYVNNSSFMVPDMGTASSWGQNRLDGHSVAYLGNQTNVSISAVGNYWGAAQGNPGAVIVGRVVFLPVWNVINISPTLTILEPATNVETSTSVTVNWDDSDADAQDPLTVSLFYDDDLTVLDGTGIEGGAGIDGWDETDELVWDVSRIPAGVYHVYGVISDGSQITTDAAAGTVAVIHPEISVTPLAIDDQLNRGNQATQSLVVRNVGATTLTGNLTLDDGAGQTPDWLSLAEDDLSLAPDDSLALALGLSAIGLDDNVYRGYVHVWSDDPSDSLLTVNVSLAVTHTAMTVSPDTVAFGTGSPGDTLVAMITVVSAGTDTLTLESLPDLAAPFAATYLDPAIAAPDDSIRIRALAALTAGGTFLDELVIPNADPGGEDVTVYLMAAASSAALALPDTVHHFGAVALGDTATWDLRLANPGDASLTITGIYSSSVAFDAVPACGFAVAAGETATVASRFLPVAADSAGGTLTVAHDGPGGPRTVTLDGRGQIGYAVFPDTMLAFGSATLGDTLLAATWLHNTGDLSFQVTEATVATPFELITTGAPWTVTAGDSLRFDLRFMPDHGGTIGSTLNVTTTDSDGSTPGVRLQGEGLVPLFVCDVSALDYGPVDPAAPVQQNLVVRNPGAGDLTVSAGLATETVFEFLSPDFPTVVPALDSLVVQVQFEPGLLQEYSDVAWLAPSFAEPDTFQVALSGIGATGSPGLSFTAHDFGQLLTGHTEAWYMPLLNTGTVDAKLILSVPAAPFVRDWPDTVLVPAASSVEVPVLFSPAELASFTDSVVVTWRDPPEQLGVVRLTGEGVFVNLVPPPTELSVDVFEADTVQTSVLLRNNGSGILYFLLFEEGVTRQVPETTLKTAKPVGPRRGDLHLVSGQFAAADDAARAIKSRPRPDCEPPEKMAIWAANKADKRFEDIPWVEISTPFPYVCPDSSETALVNLFSAGLSPAIYSGQLLLVTSDAAAESTAIDLEMRVPRMRYATHDAGEIRLTVGDEGAFGFFDTEQMESYGAGLRWPANSPSHLFHGALWVGAGPDSLSDASYDYDFEVIAGQELTVTGGELQTTHCKFADTAAASPLGIVVEQRTYAVGEDPYRDFVLVRFAVTSATPLSGVYVGLYADADIGNGLANAGRYVDGSYLGEMYATDASDSVRVGLVAMPGTEPAAFRLIHNPTYFWHGDDIADANAWAFLTSGQFDEGVPAPDDYSMVLVCGPVDLSPGEPRSFDFALAAGGSAASLQAAAGWAREKYAEIITTGDDGESLPPRFALGMPYPNPFNPSVSLPLAVPAGGGSVDVDVYDIRGRRVCRLWRQDISAGYHVLTWRGQDDDGRNVASGIYFVRAVMANLTQTRKIVMIR